MGAGRFVVTYSEPSQYHKKAKNRKQLDGYVLVSADGKCRLYSDSDALLTEAVGVDIAEGQEYESENYVVFVDTLDAGPASAVSASAAPETAVQNRPNPTMVHKRRRVGLAGGKSLQLRPAGSGGGVGKPPAAARRPVPHDAAVQRRQAQQAQPPQAQHQPMRTEPPSSNFTIVRVPSGGRKPCEIVHLLASRYEHLVVPPELAHAQVRSEQVMQPTQVEESSQVSQSQSDLRHAPPSELQAHPVMARTVASSKSSGLSEKDRNRVADRSAPAAVKAFKRLSPRDAVSRPLIHTNSRGSTTTTRDGPENQTNCSELIFPIAALADPGLATPKRTVVIPDAFESATQYRDAWSSALHEEINLSLHEHASSMLSVAKSVAPAQCGGQHAAVLNWLAHADGATAKRVQVHARKCRVGLYTHATIRKHTGHQGRRKYARGSADSEEEEEEATAEPKYFLKLQDRENSKEYSKDMLFIIASNLSFATSSRLDFVAFGRSHWHGPSSTDGSLEVGWVGAAPRLPSNKEVKVSVLRGPQINSELAMLDAIHLVTSVASANSQVDTGQASPLPLFPAILHPSAGASPLPSAPEGDAIGATVTQHVKKSSLNAEQASVLEAAASWFAPGQSVSAATENDRAQHGILLVHGVFGAGKSVTLRALTKLLVDLSSMKGVCFRRLGSTEQVPKSAKAQRPRVIVVGYTNMSVDNVLTGLMGDGFTNFVRVGSLRAIDKRLLPFTVSGGKSGKDAEADTLKELTAMLSESLSRIERSAVEQTIAELRADTGRRAGSRSSKIKDVDVVGVTCLSAYSAALDSICADQRPSIVLMDEASQMLEPMSLVALCRFRAARLLAVGDPKQLPPPLHGSSNGAENDRAARHGLGKTLFTRLAPSMPLVMLRTQYRCHPHIADIVNGLFYEDKLRSGAGLESRQPVLPVLKPASFATTAGCGHDCPERQLQSGSFVNDREGQHCVRLVQELTRFHGVAASQIGVIALYKAQANLLRSKIDEQCGVSDGAILVSTVDAFQGGERDIIIISCARTSTVGFTDNSERLNVALTRARHHLIIIGNAVTLQASKTWATVIQHQDMCRGTIDCLHEHLQNNRPSEAEQFGSEEQTGSEEQIPLEEDEANEEAWAVQVAATEKLVAAAPPATYPSETTEHGASEQEDITCGSPVAQGQVEFEPPARSVEHDAQSAGEHSKHNEGGYQSLW